MLFFAECDLVSSLSEYESATAFVILAIGLARAPRPRSDAKWKYKGKLRRTTCPNCGNKTRTPNPLEDLPPSNPSALNPQEDNTFDIMKEYLETQLDLFLECLR